MPKNNTFFLFFILMLLAGINSANAQNKSFTIKGEVLDFDTKKPIPFAYLHLEELNRTSTSSSNGVFELKNIPQGHFTLTIHRIGYKTQSQNIFIDADSLQLNIFLKESILSSDIVEVVSKAETSGSNLEHASKKVFGSELRRNLGSTLSASLSSLAGFDQRTDGSAPARPVIRGLGDERVIILQDGVSTGDVSSQSGDHAVSLDPINSSEIEIARGPAALAYGSNAVGGVINVVKNQIPSSLPSNLTGSLALNGQSVNTAGSAGFTLTAPVSNFAVQLDLSAQTALNTQTPAGEIQNTFYNNTSDGVGLSYIQPWGYVGTSFSFYGNNYGIPPNPNGHQNGVDVEMTKFQYDAKTEIILSNSAFKVVEIDASFKDYNHKELEKNSAQRVIGTEFDLLTTNFDMRARHSSVGFLGEGSVGLTTQYQDYIVRGGGARPSTSFEAGLYLIEEADFSNLHLEAGLRADFVRKMTSQDGIFYVRGARIGNIDSTEYKDRNFAELSGSFSAIYNLENGFALGTTIFRSFRAPSLEELYSEGPHLASFAFEIGNPDLKPEKAWAKEFFIRFQNNRVNLEGAVFHNSFDNYLYSENTGRQSITNPFLNDYQFVGNEALLYGAEFSMETQILNRFSLNGNVSYTIGEQTVKDEFGNQSTRPLPQIPPFKGNVSAKYSKSRFELGSRLRFASNQDRIGEFETQTEGYSLVDIFSQYRISSGNYLHTFALNVNNVLDTEYYNHLSRIKDLRPESGRNISLLYKLYF